MSLQRLGLELWIGESLESWWHFKPWEQMKSSMEYRDKREEIKERARSSILRVRPKSKKEQAVKRLKGSVQCGRRETKRRTCFTSRKHAKCLERSDKNKEMTTGILWHTVRKKQYFSIFTLMWVKHCSRIKSTHIPQNSKTIQTDKDFSLYSQVQSENPITNLWNFSKPENLMSSLSSLSNTQKCTNITSKLSK